MAFDGESPTPFVHRAVRGGLAHDFAQK